MKIVIILNILSLILCPTFVESKQDDYLILGSGLITASEDFVINTLENSIDANQFGTFLLHLPSSITYEYTSYTNEVGTLLRTSMPNKTNITTSKTLTVSKINKSNATTTNQNRAWSTSSNTGKYNYSTHYTPMSSNFTTKSSLGSGNHGAIATPTETLLSIVYLIFFLF